MCDTSIDEHKFLVDLIHDMLKTGVLDRIKLYQDLNNGLGSLEEIAGLYENDMKPMLQDNREKVFADYFKTFESVDPADKTTHTLPNEPYGALLKRIAMTTISETSKDFTLIFNIEEAECTADASVGLTDL